MSTDTLVIVSNLAVTLASLVVTVVTIVASYVTFHTLDRDTQETVRETLTKPVPGHHHHPHV